MTLTRDRTTTIAFRATGCPEQLKDFSVCGIRFASTKSITGRRLEATWVCETTDYQEALHTVHDNIDAAQMEDRGIELIYLA